MMRAMMRAGEEPVPRSLPLAVASSRPWDYLSAAAAAAVAADRYTYYKSKWRGGVCGGGGGGGRRGTRYNNIIIAVPVRARSRMCICSAR